MKNRVIVGIALSVIVAVAYLWMAKHDNPPSTPPAKPAVEQRGKTATPIPAKPARVQVAEQEKPDDIERKLNELGFSKEKTQPIQVRQ